LFEFVSILNQQQQGKNNHLSLFLNPIIQSQHFGQEALILDIVLEGGQG